ncbi:uncharacterized protein IWZ02DRAFT_437119 [Phyllosticta citriasiana]|uniref:uncharacterized protein n=1 Tax=Phyllosticta citriasiana TaxID=595635 RepID=UPI0030FDC9F7
MPHSSSQKCTNKRKNQYLPTPQAGSSRKVRPRLTQSSPAPALRSSPPPLLPSNADPFHPEKANRVPTDEMVGLWLATIVSCDHRQDSALAVETIRKTMNIDLHWERILQAAGHPIRQHLDKTEAAKDLRAFVERTLRDELPFKLCWILAQTVKNAAHLAKLQQLLRLASEEYRGPLMTPSHRKQFQDLTNAWYLPNAGSSSVALRNELLSTAQHQPQEEVEVPDLEPRANLRPEHHANRRGASLPADEDPRTNNSPEAQPARRVESSSSRSQADLNPQSTPLLQPENLAGDRGPDVLHWELSRIRRTLAPRVAWFLDEERLRTMRGKDLLPDLIDDGRSLFAWYKLDELIEASGTRDPYAMHVERSWKRLDLNEKDAWENRFMRFRIQRIPIEHVRQRLEISGASLASTTPAPLAPSTATAPTASLQEPSVKVEIVELSSDDDGSEEEQKPSLTSYLELELRRGSTCYETAQPLGKASDTGPIPFAAEPTTGTPEPGAASSNP